MGVGLDLTSHSPRCFRMVLMTSRSSMKLRIRMIPRHFGQVRGSPFPDQVGDRLRSSGSAGPSFSGIPLNFYRLPGCRGPRRLRFLFAFPGRHYCSTHSTGPSAPPCPGCVNTWRPATPGRQRLPGQFPTGRLHDGDRQPEFHPDPVHHPHRGQLQEGGSPADGGGHEHGSGRQG